MATVLMVKKLMSLHAIDEAGEAVMRNIGRGEIVSIEVKRPRNVQFHRKLFALLSIILANQEFYKSIDDLLDVAKLAVGHCHTIETKFGPVKIPSSIAFASMDANQFNSFYEKVIVWVAQDVIPGLQRYDIDEAVEAELLRFGD